ncbi:hypothetical protein ACSQ6I_04280 [Anabaena sp. WFMT]|uniref:hypothetical protein n=1 Tax=Anabaena sp. WFMT TaxID=3449730 RepID=UPI003F2195FE
MEPTTNTSSFGQLHDKVKGNYVEESLLKIIPITSNAAIAFAGDVQFAQEIVEFLKENFCDTETITNLFNRVNASLGPFDSRRPVELLLAYAPSNTEPQIIYWNSKNGLSNHQSNYLQIGSLTSYHAALTQEIQFLLARGNLDPDRMLPILIAVVQSYGIHNNLIDQYVGGTIFGLRICKGEITWQEDTNFILYDPSFENINYISAFVRDNALVVNSSYTNESRIFAHSISMPNYQEWLESWGSFIINHVNSDQYRYWVFLSTAARVITVIRRDNFENENNYFQLQYHGDGNFSLGLNLDFQELLRQPLTDLGDGSLPFRLNFRNA